MRVWLISPKMHSTARGTKAKYRLVPPQSLMVLAAVTPPQHEVRILDENVAPLPKDERPDLIGITVYVASAPRAYEIARKYRRWGVPVVLGGLHVTAAPEDAMKHADAIVVGDGDEVWPQVVADAAWGRLKRRYDAAPVPADRIAIPMRAAVARGAYLTRNSILATRGCNRSCRFCYKSALSAAGYRQRPIEEVVKEISQLDGNYFALLDDNLVADRDYARRLFRALAGLGKVWMGAASLDAARDDELLDLMARSGCLSLFMGIESINQNNLDAMRKGSNRVAAYAEAIRRIRARGIMINGSFVLGFDGDDETAFDRTVEWAQEQRLDTATFHILTPYPGTPLFRDMEAEGRILTRDWRQYDTAHVVFRPKRMSAEALRAGYEHAYDRYYTLGAIARRVLADPWGRAPRLFLNMGYKRMNALWPALAKMGMVSLPFWLFIATSRRHRAKWTWQPAEAIGTPLEARP